MSAQIDVAALLARHPLEWSVSDKGLVYEETVGVSYVGHVDDIVPALATALRAALADQRRFEWLKQTDEVTLCGIAYRVRAACIHDTADGAIDAAIGGGGV